MTDLDAARTDVTNLREACEQLRESIAEQFIGQEDVSELLVLGLLAGGHVLLEGSPGLGKTTLVRANSSKLDLSFRRVQFTPDLMPPDVLGTRMLEIDDDGSRHFSFEPGPIFTNVLLADEINRATPRTQSALLEAMQEGQVTTYGQTRELEQPFMVIATQNPIEMEGTYPLPEAQLDRFLFKVTIEMPEREALSEILNSTTGTRTEAGGVVLDGNELRNMRALVRQVPVSSDVVGLVSALILATHPASPDAPERVATFVRHGASPRGGQAILLASKARALTRGRVHVTVEDIEALAIPALRHRILLGYEGEAADISTDDLVTDALAMAKRTT